MHIFVTIKFELPVLELCIIVNKTMKNLTVPFFSHCKIISTGRTNDLHGIHETNGKPTYVALSIQI